MTGGGARLWATCDLANGGLCRHVNNFGSNRVFGHYAVGYITPKDMLAARQQEIHAERDRKLDAARKMRKDRRQQAA